MLLSTTATTAAKVLGVVVLSIAIIGAVYYIQMTNNSNSGGSSYVELDPPDVTGPISPSSSILGQYTKAAVVSNGEPCAVIGRQTLEKGGNVIDALIATMLCDGVFVPQNMGVGGGFFLTLYNKSSNNVVTLNARERAPAAATQDMFNDSSQASQIGGLAVAVPGELKGYHEAWEKYGGGLSWRELFEPTIKLCLEGIAVNKHLQDNLVSMKDVIFANQALRDIMVINNTLVKVGDNITFPTLAATLRVIADSPIGADELYNGSLTDAFVKDIQEAGGIITKEDMNNYVAEWGEPVVSKLSGNLTMYSMPPPGSGILVGFIMRILDGFVQSATTDLQITQRIIEAFKHAYGRRTELADPGFYDISKTVNDLTSDSYILQTRSKISDNSTSQNDSFYGAIYAQVRDHGTANIVVLAPNGDAAVATSTINLLFGSQVVSKSTGIILNDEMDDFSSTYENYFDVPPSHANFIEPGKRPFSSMCPTIFVDSNGNVRLAIGAAGGTKITTSTAFVSIQNLWFNKNVKEAVDFPRIHHQLQPMRFDYEYGTLRSVAKGMADIGHTVLRRAVTATWGSCVTAIARNGSIVEGNSDFRRPGGVAGF
uniref:Gamma-glutamyltransferase n=1 Tax=Clastoptera arizonana TaxID=38151 RepID=A0A1B6D5D2_9HEMI